jgi:hypothetical protein
MSGRSQPYALNSLRQYAVERSAALRLRKERAKLYIKEYRYRRVCSLCVYTKRHARAHTHRSNSNTSHTSGESDGGLGHKFSKVTNSQNCLVTLYSTYIRALTVENVCRGLGLRV